MNPSLYLRGAHVKLTISEILYVLNIFKSLKKFSHILTDSIMLKHLKVVGLIAVLLGSTYVFYAMQTPFPKQIKSGLSIARVADNPQLTVTITSQTSVSLA